LKKSNNYIGFGLFFYGIFIGLGHFNLLPDFISGLCLGLCIALMLIGIYSMNHDTSKLKDCKMNFFKRCLNK